MNKSYPFSEINSALASANNIGILLPENPDYDIVAASLGLFLSLVKAGKTMSIASPTPMTVGFSHLVGLDKITNKLNTERNITLSIDYPLDNLEKVTLPDNTKTINLVFKIKNGAPPIPADKISFTQPTQSINLHFLIGGKDLASFEKLTPASEIQKSNSISIHLKQNTDAKISIVDPTASSYSEIITAILVSLSLPSDQDVAQNLFLGLNKATANFSSQKVSADTFEAAALCLRAGANQKLRTKTPDPVKPETAVTKIKSSPPSPDWLEPKIYRGTSLI